MCETPSRRKPSGPSTISVTVMARTVVEREARVEEAQERTDRAAGIVVFRLGQQQRRAAFDIAQVDVVAERRADDAAVGGDGEHDFRLGIVPVRQRMQPASMPVPTAAIVCALEKISASGPMPTSRYWHHMPRAISTSLSCAPRASRAAAPEGRRRRCRTMSLRIAFRRLRIAARALLDHPLDHRDGEGHARRLDRLEVDGSEQPRLRGVAFIGRRVGENVFERAEPFAGRRT